MTTTHTMPGPLVPARNGGPEPMTPVFAPDSDPDRVRVGTYARQSHKNETDSKASPLAQRHSGESYTASQPGWEHVAHYEDVGISGYDPDAYRPGYEEMMQDVRAGKLDVIVVFQLSRLTRKGVMDALTIREELDKYGVSLVSVTEPFVNTSHDNPFAVAFFALIAALAHQESKNKSEFIRRSQEQIFARGGHVSGSVPWWAEAEPIQVDGVTIRRLKPKKEMVPLATRIVEMGKSGKAYNKIATILQGEKVPTPAMMNERLSAQVENSRRKRKGGKADSGPTEWQAGVVARFLLDPRIGGFATKKAESRKLSREILRDDDGEPIAPHIGLISPSEWYELQEVLNGHKREKKESRGGELTFLGSWGILHCGVCRSAMTISRTNGTYVCNLRRAVGDVPKHTVRVPMAETDEIVARRMWTRVGALDPVQDEADAALLHEAARRFAHTNANAAVEAERLAVRAQLSHVQGTLEQLYADRAEGLYAGKVGKAAFADQVRKLTSHEESCTLRLEELDEAVQQTTTLPLDEWAGDGDDPIGPGSPWSLWSVEERRSFTAIWVDSVVVAPAGPRSEWGPRDDSWGRTDRRLSVEWARPPAEDEAEADGPLPTLEADKTGRTAPKWV